MDLGLKNQVAVVTAASRGLGAAVARQLAQEAAQVVICGRDEERLSATVADIKASTDAERSGIQVLGIQADVTVPADVDALMQQTLEAFGRLDILVVNAGGPPSGAFANFQPEDWEKATQLMLMSAVRLCYAALPHMKRQGSGSIVFMTSYSVKQPIANLILSNSIRLAIIGLMKSMSQELGASGIRVNAVAPGWTLTERVVELLAARAKKNGTTAEAEAAKIVAETSLGRMGQPDEFAKATVFLASPAASYITGITLPIDGGAIKASL